MLKKIIYFSGRSYQYCFIFFYFYRICWVKNCFKYLNYMRYKKNNRCLSQQRLFKSITLGFCIKKTSFQFICPRFWVHSNLSYSPQLNPTVLFVVLLITFPFSEIRATISSPLIRSPIFSIFPTELIYVLSPEISESRLLVVSFRYFVINK